MDYMEQQKLSILWRLLTIIVLFSLMIYLSAITVATADSRKTHTNRQYGFTLKYPSNYKLSTSGQGGI